MKVVLTIGTGNSGCGAIHDYLIKNTKCLSPFKGQEFRMMDDPDGIINLYHNFYVNCSINNSSNAIMRFKNYVDNLIKLELLHNNKNIKIFDKKISLFTDEYIKNITILNYNSFPQFISIQTGFFKKNFYHYNKKIFGNKNQSFFKMYLPVKKNLFFKQTTNYVKKIINHELKNKRSDYVVLDQALSIFNFSEIFSYFKDAKIILVTRDPRGIYNSMKTRKSSAYPYYDFKIWVKWYEQIMQNFNEYKKKIPKKFSKNILEIKFEDFVLNYDDNQKKILNFLNLKKKNDNFNIQKTRFNAFKAKKNLSNFENKYIKKKLSQYLQW